MKTLVVFIFILLITDIFATEIVTVKLDIKSKEGIFTRGSSSILQAEFGQKFKVKREDLEAEFTATRSLKNKNHIIISGNVFDLRNGQKKLIISPKIITELGHEASVLSSNNSAGSIYIKATPTLESLAAYS